MAHSWRTSLGSLGATAWANVRNYRASETLELTAGVRRRQGGSFVRLPLGVVHYELKGPPSGGQVVLVPGFSVPSYIWDPTFDGLARAGFRVLRYDLYGRGFSDRPAGRYDREMFDRQLVDLLDALDLTGPVDLAGVSVGGAICATFTVRHPQRVGTLVLIDPRSPGAIELPVHVRMPLVGECYMALSRAAALARSQPSDFHEPDRFPDWSSKFAEQMRYRGFRRALLSTMRHYLRQDVGADYGCVGRSPRPVMVLWGEHDRHAATVIEQLRALIPRAQFHPIPQAGHLPQYERPETVVPLVCGFLASTPRGAHHRPRPEP